MTGVKWILAVLLLSFFFTTSTGAMEGEIGEPNHTSLSVDSDGVTAEEAGSAIEKDTLENANETATGVGGNLREWSTGAIPSENATSEDPKERAALEGGNLREWSVGGIPSEKATPEDPKERATLEGGNLREWSTGGIPRSLEEATEEYSCINELKISLLSMTCEDPGIIDYKCWDARNSITINGKEYTRNNRGFNIAVIDFKSGEVEETISYDTYSDIQESRRLEEYIRKLPTNKIVCGVVKDEGHNRMTEGAKNAIALLLNKREIPFNKWRTSYAFIGITSSNNQSKNHAWIQDKWTDTHQGPVELNVVVPLVEAGADARCCSRSLGTSNNSPADIPAKQPSDFPRFTFNEGLKIVGKTVYMSDVDRILETKPGGYMGKLDPKQKFDVVIKTDTFYCGKKEKPQTNAVRKGKYKLFGISKFKLIARHAEFDDCSLDFNFDGMSFKDELLPKNGKNGHIRYITAASGTNGQQGQRGLDGLNGTDVTLAYLTGKGKLDIKNEGMAGSAGGHGGDGGRGFVGKEGWCDYGCNECRYSERFRSPGRGGSGGNAGAAGLAGNGGSAGRLNLFSQKSADTGAEIRVTGCKGRRGPLTAKPGKVGKGGRGGHGYAKGIKWGCKQTWSWYGMTYFRCRNDGLRDCFPDKKRGTDGKDGNFERSHQKNSKDLKISLVSMTCSDPGIIDHKCWLAENSIQINGEEYTSNKRGFNIAVIDFKTGIVEEKRSYDTYSSSEESNKMEAFIKQLPKNRIVCGVVKDEGNKQLTQGAKDAIASLLHKKTIPLNTFRTSYAFVGFTSPDNHFWIQDKWTNVNKGPARLTVVPLSGRSLRGKISTKKEQFQPYFDDVVQQLVLRKAEDLYIEGETAKAKDILETAKGLMKSDKRHNIEYCNKLIEQITSGLNFFGKRDNEFSTQGWTTTASRVNDLVQRASDQATRINTLLDKNSLMDVMKSTNSFFTTAMLTPVENELKETDQRMNFEKIKKMKALDIMKTMEIKMLQLADKMKQDLEGAITAREEEYATQATQFALTLLSGVFSLGSDIGNPLGTVSQIIDGTQQIMEFAGSQDFDNTNGENCRTKYDAMEAFAMNMMKMQLKAPPRNTSNVDLDDLDTVAKAELLKVQALEKRDDLLLGFKCLIEVAGFDGDTLEGTIGAYFDYSFSRITVFGQVIQHDINFRQLQFKKERLKTTINSLKDANKKNMATNFNPILQNARLLHKEHLIEVFRELEKDVLFVLYEQAMAFQFITLWDTKFIENLRKRRKHSKTAVSDQDLKGLQNYLKNLQCKYTKCYNRAGSDKVKEIEYLWIYTPKTHKTLFQNIWTNGRGYVTITKDGICSSNSECVNMRLRKIYVQVIADFGEQRSIAIEISHSGSNFFFMAPNGKSNVTYYQPKPLWKLLNNYKDHRSATKECHKGTDLEINIEKILLLNEACERYRLGLGRSYCRAKFPAKVGISMCSSVTTDIQEQLLGTTACRSLFSEYTISLPKNKAGIASARMNSKHFDWKKVTKIKFFASASGFRNPPTMEECSYVPGCGAKKNEVKGANESNRIN